MDYSLLQWFGCSGGSFGLEHPLYTFFTPFTMPSAATSKKESNLVDTVEIYGVKADIYRSESRDGGRPYYRLTMPYTDYPTPEGMQKSRSFTKTLIPAAHMVIDKGYAEIMKLEAQDSESAQAEADTEVEVDTSKSKK